MNRVWERIVKTAQQYVAQGVAVPESDARKIVLRIVREEAVDPPSDVLNYWAWSLARRTQLS